MDRILRCAASAPIWFGQRESLRLEQENALIAAKSHERQTALLRKRVVLVEEELRHLKENLKASEGGPAFEVMLQLLAMACVRKSVDAQIAIRDSDIWKKASSGRQMSPMSK